MSLYLVAKPDTVTSSNIYPGLSVMLTCLELHVCSIYSELDWNKKRIKLGMTKLLLL